MQIDILSPNGYCYGVKRAINLALDIKKENPNKKVYVLGMLVHNNYVCDFLLKNQIFTIDVPPNKYKEVLLKLKSDDIVIFTAHGHDIELDQIIKDKKIQSYDAICPMVKHNNDLIKNALEKGKKVIYIGQENHPEAIGALSMSNDIIFMTNKLLDLSYYDKKLNYFVINQTTLNIEELKGIHKDLKSIFPNIEIADEICAATRLRQQTILQLTGYDVLLVVGSLKSSNTNKLYDIATNKLLDISTFRIESLKDIPFNKLNKQQKIAITGGTSTPSKLLQLIKEEITNYFIK